MNWFLPRGSNHFPFGCISRFVQLSFVAASFLIPISRGITQWLFVALQSVVRCTPIGCSLHSNRLLNPSLWTRSSIIWEFTGILPTNLSSQQTHPWTDGCLSPLPRILAFIFSDKSHFHELAEKAGSLIEETYPVEVKFSHVLLTLDTLAHFSTLDIRSCILSKL